MSIAPPRKRGGSAARPFTDDELAQAESAKAVLREALEARWPLRDRWGERAWSVTRSRSQDGSSLRLSICWEDGPTGDEVIRLAESLAWPVGLPIVLSLRRRPMANERRPPLHRIQSRND